MTSLAAMVPKSCVGNFKCKQFAKNFEQLLLDQKVKGKKICLKSEALIFSDKNGNISETGDHVAIQVGDMVFDNNNVDGVPYNKWLDDLGGTYFIKPYGKGAPIDLYEVSLGSKTKCD